MLKLAGRLRLTLFFIISCYYVSHGQEKALRFLVTSDIHGNLFPVNMVDPDRTISSMAAIAALVENQRKDHPDLILLDNGDILQGTPAAFYANYLQKSSTNLFSRVLNFMGYDAATLGNHDIECGPEVYTRIREEMNMPWLGANIIDSRTGNPFFQPYTIINRSDIKIAVLGLCTPNIPNWLPEKLWAGLYFQSMLEASMYWSELILEQEKPDILIGLFHSGWGDNQYSPSTTPVENAALYIASNVPGFDVIFTGHDHTLRYDVITNSQSGGQTLILGPGAHARNIGVVDVLFHKDKRKKFNIIDKKATILEVDPSKTSNRYNETFNKDLQDALSFANKPVAELLDDVTSQDVYFGNSAFIDMIHRVQLEATGTDVSFTAPLEFNTTLEKGILHIRDFFKLYRYENYLYTMEMTGAEIKDYLEYSYDQWVNTMYEASDPMLMYRIDDKTGKKRLKNIFYNFDSASGIRYVVDLTKSKGGRIHILGFQDGRPFSERHSYKVAINSYRGSGGGGHLSNSLTIPKENWKERIIHVSDKEIRSELIRYFTEKGKVSARADSNWKFIPENWVEKAKARESVWLFGE